MSDFHISVMVDEVLQLLDIKKKSWYIDCNLGGGGHTKGILDKGGSVVGIDLDKDAINEVSKSLKEYIDTKKLILIQDNFSHLKEIVKRLDKKPISGILFDLGVSSHQLETPNRGFSFNSDGPLDMRMDQSAQQATAADLINGLNETELLELFWKLGEERFAKRIAERIVEARRFKKIEDTNQLAQIITSVRPRLRTDRTHPATRVFQALRIAVNDELNSLKETLPQALEVLEQRGRLVVISFHSLEDRIVKKFFDEEEDRGNLKILTDKPLTPEIEEIDLNPRSRSGKLRAAEKI
ncbi:16S rRNA (cytosine(1402)-N(4))-methyltransferase RsmH [Candidatus Daviesbacteria bacterium]|nr:16S rRNA (cytosine(1402)-N(4))-methyltransferase RsmH [Candidatus Daviesbacteria bacterium]